jgi:hypothetical protein
MKDVLINITAPAKAWPQVEAKKRKDQTENP